jgi:hypothetical protein
MKKVIAEAIIGLGREIERAQGLFPMDDCAQRHLPHYYLGVIEEEFEEFKAEVFKFNLGKNRDTRPAMKVELLQLAAMAMRAYLEV